jgi:rhodanese-related sulfurtransferase
MKTREKITALLLSTGVILALLPLTGNRSFSGKPEKVLSEILNKDAFFSVDQVARFIVKEDSTVQLIDVRSTEVYRKNTMPGSVNIPYGDFVGNDPDKYLNNRNIKNIFISDDDYESCLAMAYSKGLGYSNSYVMKGGLKEWTSTVMESKFTGERISAGENALFETRTRAARLFNEMNSLPDSLKLKFMESRKFSAKKLDGGCE